MRLKSDSYLVIHYNQTLEPFLDDLQRIRCGLFWFRGVKTHQGVRLLTYHKQDFNSQEEHKKNLQIYIMKLSDANDAKLVGSQSSRPIININNSNK